ncbi:MAG: cob(I)yrinic acid a,c-diamide adenosyltransferase [Lentisphaeria bacterium]
MRDRATVMQTQGYVQVYTGDGKGKTTAALGLALRMMGAGKKVFLGQFIKGNEYNELKALQRFSDLMTVEQWGRGCFIRKQPDPADIEAAEQGLLRAREVLQTKEYGLVILDEACGAVKSSLFTVEELLDCITSRRSEVEVVITGRNAPDELCDYADLVTECKALKHYFTKGVKARNGIEK